MSLVEVATSECANCGTPLDGAYCGRCGQKAAGPDVSLHDFFHEAFHEFLHLDGKIVQTLRLMLTKPGQLTKEFLEGRRVRYISPLRIYLTCSLMFFALAAWAPRVDHPFFTISKVNGEAGMDPATVKQRREAATDRANDAIVHTFPRVMFGLMPAFGLLTWAFYKKARPFYAAHLYYSIHFHAFVFLVLTIATALRLAVGSASNASVAVAMFVILTYHFASLRRVFGGSRLATAWKGTSLWVIHFAIMVAAILAIGIWSARGVL